jgi:hypothetical protein
MLYSISPRNMSVELSDFLIKLCFKTISPARQYRFSRPTSASSRPLRGG